MSENFENDLNARLIGRIFAPVSVEVYKKCHTEITYLFVLFYAKLSCM